MKKGKQGSEFEQKDPIVVPLGEGEEIVFRHIPAGSFRMGQRGFGADEEPVTEVFVEEFWMAETPVTRGQYKIMAGWCMEELVKDDDFKGNEPDEIKTEEDGRRPVTNVCWNEARLVARWLTVEMDKQSKLPQGYCVDLPGEAEWEKACRAGMETEYYSGDGKAALEEVGWFEGDFAGEPFPVKSKSANGWGLSDCHGSVLQWCRDSWDDGQKSSRLRVHGEAKPWEGSEVGEAKNRVLRGGSWNFTAAFCRAAYRDRFRPGNRFFGFRLAVVPGPVKNQSSSPEVQGAEPRRKREGGTTDLATGGGGAGSSQKKGGDCG